MSTKETTAGRKRDGNEAGQWEVEYRHEADAYEITSSRDGLVGQFTGRSALLRNVTDCALDGERAALIVRAVTAHDELVAACAEALTFAEGFVDGAPDASAQSKWANALAHGLRAAIAKAGGAL